MKILDRFWCKFSFRGTKCPEVDLWAECKCILSFTSFLERLQHQVRFKSSSGGSNIQPGQKATLDHIF